MNQGRTSIVVTGVGLCTPLGRSAEETFAALLAGGSAIGPVTRLAPAPGTCYAAAECAAADLAPPMRVAKHAKYAGRAVTCALHAVAEAAATARLPDDRIEPRRFAVYSATGQTGLDVEEFFAALTATGETDDARLFAQLGGRASRLVAPHFSLRTLANGALALAAAEVGARGPSSNHVHGELGGVHALEEAMWDIIEDRADIALVLACDSLLHPSTWLAYERRGLLSRREPSRALAPFDAGRDGVALGEGAAALVVERAEHATARGLPVTARVLRARVEPGAPPNLWTTDALALTRLLRLDDPGALLRPSLLVARGLGTQPHDAAEAESLAGHVCDGQVVTAIKGATGYLGAASAIVEAVVAILALRHGTVPPVAHLEIPDAPATLPLARTRCDLDRTGSRVAVTLSAGWDGSWGALVLAQ